MKKHWCVYGGEWRYWGFGKVVKESSDTIQILYSEGRNPRGYDAKYVKRFDTLSEAVTEYQKHSGHSLEEVKRQAFENFPKDFKEEE